MEAQDVLSLSYSCLLAVSVSEVYLSRRAARQRAKNHGWYVRLSTAWRGVASFDMFLALKEENCLCVNVITFDVVLFLLGCFWY